MKFHEFCLLEGLKLEHSNPLLAKNKGRHSGGSQTHNNEEGNSKGKTKLEFWLYGKREHLKRDYQFK